MTHSQKSYKKRLLLITLVVFIMLVCIIVIMQQDEELSLEARAWVESLEEAQSNDSEAFVFLFGIFAAEDEEVLTVGKERLNAYRKAEANPNHYLQEKITFDDYPEDKQLRVTLFLDAENSPNTTESFLTRVISAKEDLVIKLSRADAVYQRYRRFINYQEFSTLTKPHIAAVIPDYKYLTLGHQTSIIHAVHLLNQGQGVQANNQLRKDLIKLRKHLVLADNLIQKMVVVSLIARHLDALAFVSKKVGISFGDPVPPLTSFETNLMRPMMSEFGFFYSILLNLDQHPEFFEVGGDTPSWIVRMVFKPHATANIAWSTYEEVAINSLMPIDEFASLQFRPDTSDWEFDFFNLVGNILNRIKDPDFYYYIGRIHDLNVKIALVNFVMSDKKSPLINPYYPNQEVDLKQLRTTSSGCLNGPFEDSKRVRCLPVDLLFP